MKRVLVVLLAVLTAVSFGSAFVDADNSQRSAMERAAAAVGEPLRLSNDPGLADPDVTFGALREAAAATGANVFRTSAGFGPSGASHVVQYLLLTGRTRFFDSFGLTSGRYLTPADMAASTAYLSTLPSGSPEQVGTLRDFGGNDLVEVRSLRTAFESLPVAGDYQVELPAGVPSSTFVSALAEDLGSRIAGSSFSASDFAADGPSFVGQLHDNYSTVLTGAGILIIMLTAILLAYRQLYEAKAVGVMKLHGYGVARTWYRSTGRFVLATFAVAGAAAVGASAAVPEAPGSFAVTVLGSVARSAVIMLAVSLLAVAYIDRVQISDSLKNRKNTVPVFFLNTGVKLVASVLAVVTGAGLWGQYQGASEERARLAGWEMTRDFGIFYPTSTGNDLVETQTGQAGSTVAQVYDLYPQLDRRGSVFVDSSSYEPDALAQEPPPGTFRSIQVNPNYLRQFPVLDEGGRPIEVDEATRDWIVLVPAKRRAEGPAITAYVQQIRHGEDGQSGLATAERAAFDRAVPAWFPSQQVRIVWTADDQQLFSFNPWVNPDSGNTITDPIVQVMTLSNSVGLDRANMITGAADTGLKVRLVDRDTAATMAQLSPSLESEKLDDNLRHLVTMNEYASGRLHDLERGIRDVAVAAAALVIAMLVLAVQNLTLAFELFSRRIVVRRLHGASFVRAYREVGLLFVAAWVVQLAGAVTANRAGISPFATATSSGRVDDGVVLWVAGAVVAVELVVSAIALRAIQRRRLVHVLKEEF